MSIDISKLEASREAIEVKINEVGPSDQDKVNSLQYSLMITFKFNLDTLLTQLRGLDPATITSNANELIGEMNLCFGTMSEMIAFVNNLIPTLISDTDILNYSNLITSGMASDSMCYTIVSMVQFIANGSSINANTQAIALDNKAINYLNVQVRALENKVICATC
jgi:hypothetical protein